MHEILLATVLETSVKVISKYVTHMEAGRWMKGGHLRKKVDSAEGLDVETLYSRN